MLRLPFFLCLLCVRVQAVVLYQQVSTVEIAKSVAKAAQPYCVSVTVYPNSAPLIVGEGDNETSRVMLLLDVNPSHVDRVREISSEALQGHSYTLNEVGVLPAYTNVTNEASAGAVNWEMNRPPSILLAQDQSEFNVTAHAHEPVLLTFEGIPGTGYKWLVDHSLTSAELKVGHIKMYPCHASLATDPLLADKACMYHVRVQPMEPGVYTLTLLHARPWDRTDNPSWKVVHFNVGPRIGKNEHVVTY